MSNSKISALTSATTPLVGTETLPIVQSSATTKVTVANLTAGRAVGMSQANIVSTTGTAETLVSMQTAFNNPSGNKSILWKDGSTNALGRISVDYSGSATTMRFGSLYNSGYQTSDVFTISADGNFTPVVAAKGINFTANTPASGMTSQLLNWYEEGNWTPNQGGGLTVIGAFSSTGKYTRNGRTLTVSGTVTGATSVAVAAAGIITTNLPFTVGTAGHGNVTNAALTSFAAIICTSTNVTSASAIAATGTLTFSATYFV